MQSSQSDAILKFPSGISSSHDSAPVPSAAASQQIQIYGGPLLHPLVLEVEEVELGQVLVSDGLVSTYGVGDTLGEAVDEFLEMLLDYHRELDESRGELSRSLREELRVLEYFLGQLH